jgi:hypothetical protein
MRGLNGSASFPIMRAKHIRIGVRIRGARGHPEVRRAFIRFARWLRKEYDFPIRVPVYLFPSEQIITMHGDRVSASFFAPYDRSLEPFIRVATGDYVQLKKERGRDNALAACLNSFAHEFVHYQQWVATGEISERGVIRRAQSIVDRYAMTTDRP